MTSTRAVHGPESDYDETVLVVEPRTATPGVAPIFVEVHEDGALYLSVDDGPAYEFYEGMGVDWLERLAELVVAALNGRYEETRAATRNERPSGLRGGHGPIDPLTPLLWVAAMKSAAVAGVIAAIDVLVLHANPAVLGVAAAFGAAAGAASGKRRRRDPTKDPLDMATARLEDCPAHATPRSVAMTALGGLGTRPIFTATWLVLRSGSTWR